MPIFECSRCNRPTFVGSGVSAQICPDCDSAHYRVLEGSLWETRQPPRALAASDHACLVFRDPGEIALLSARYLTEGIDRGDRVMSALTPELRQIVGGLLAPDVTELVDWHDPLAIYGDFDADRVAATYDALIGAEPRRTRILAAVDHQCADGVDPAEVDRYECLAHGIITKHGATAVCLYDERELGPEFLAVAHRRHPLTVIDGLARRNRSFEYQPA